MLGSRSPIFLYLLEGVHYYAGVGAVVHEDGGGPHPRLEVVQAEWDVLGVVSVENPDLAVGGRFGDAVPVVVEQHPLLARVPAQPGGEAPHFFKGRVEALQSKEVRNYGCSCLKY